MIKHFVGSILILVLLSTGLLAAEDQKTMGVQNVSEEDLEVIEVLDILELMEVVAQMELLQDMKQVVGDKGDEKKK